MKKSVPERLKYLRLNMRGSARVAVANEVYPKSINPYGLLSRKLSGYQLMKDGELEQIEAAFKKTQEESYAA